MGVQGLAWAWSLAYMMSAVLAFVVLRPRIGPFGLPLAVRTTVPVSRMVVAAAAMAVVVLTLPLSRHAPAWSRGVADAGRRGRGCGQSSETRSVWCAAYWAVRSSSRGRPRAVRRPALQPRGVPP